MRVVMQLVVVASLGCGRIGFGLLGADDDGRSDGGDGDGSSDDADPTSTYNIAFVTSTTSRLADLGGLAGADAECNRLAGLAGLPGTYVAWMSDATTTATSRLGSARGWVRVDGKPVVDTVADLLAGSILHPILLTETNVAMTGLSGIHTATSANGAHAEDCNGFTSTTAAFTERTGIASATFATWTENFANTCDQSLPHYCFGVDRSVPLQYTPATGRRAFVTANAWISMGGRTMADNTCQAAADGRNLGGTWRALIATTGETAASRFTASGPLWVRLDGIALAALPSTLLDGATLDAPLNLTETGQYRGSNPAHTGATSTTALGTMATTCNNWGSPSGTDTGRIGLMNSVSLYFQTPILQTCDSGASLYCLEP